MPIQNVAHPIGVAALPDGHVPCADCGSPTLDGSHDLRVFARDIGLGRHEDLPHGIVRLGVCSACAERRALAGSIVDENPMRAYGSQAILAERLACALIPLAALHQPIPDTWTRQTIANALHRLEHVGAAMCWSRLFSPVRREGASTKTCASEAWLFVDSHLLAEARRQVVELMIDGMPPRSWACPSTACIICGLAASRGRREVEAWTPVTGKSHRGRHICATCAVHYDGQAIGPRLVDACVLDLLDADGRLRRRRETDPMWSDSVPWIDLGTDVPNRTRLEHLPLAKMEVTLRRGIW